MSFCKTNCITFTCHDIIEYKVFSYTSKESVRVYLFINSKDCGTSCFPK